MTASDFVNCSRTQSLVAQPDTSSTAAGISTPIFIICRITPPPLWALANVWNECEAAWESNNHASPGPARGHDAPGLVFQMWRLLGGREPRRPGSEWPPGRRAISSRLHDPCNRYMPGWAP